jgi:uncharacterized protein YraI
MKLTSFIAAAAIALLGAATAQASPAWTTANLNIRSGPDLDFPSVGLIPEGTPVEVAGCLRDESWCDVGWEGNHGWVFTEYLSVEDGPEFVPILDVDLQRHRVPYVVYSADDYWGRYYVGKPWYADRARWVAYRPRPRPNWIAPPPGPRQAGWWRPKYVVQIGMGPPPGRGWKPKHHHH